MGFLAEQNILCLVKYLLAKRNNDHSKEAEMWHCDLAERMNNDHK